MDLNEIVAEMHRKPDAHLALEWIADSATTLDEAKAVTEAAYFEDVEES